MRKYLFMLLAIVAGVTFADCDGKKKNTVPAESAGKAALVVENLVSADREYIFLHETKEYRYYETTVKLADWLDADGQDGTVESVTNTFYYVEMDEGGKSGNGKAVFAEHTADYSDYVVKYGIWVGDKDLSDQGVILTFREAFERMMTADYVKPHSRYCVLRKELGSADANPQYVFGNIEAQLYVDAVTGDVSDRNPAYRGSETE